MNGFLVPEQQPVDIVGVNVVAERAVAVIKAADLKTSQRASVEVALLVELLADRAVRVLPLDYVVDLVHSQLVLQAVFLLPDPVLLLSLHRLSLTLLIHVLLVQITFLERH